MIWIISAESWHKIDFQSKDKEFAARDIRQLEKRLLDEGKIKSMQPLFQKSMDAQGRNLVDQCKFEWFCLTVGIINLVRSLIFIFRPSAPCSKKLKSCLNWFISYLFFILFRITYSMCIKIYIITSPILKMKICAQTNIES